MDAVRVAYKTQKTVIAKAAVHISVLITLSGTAQEQLRIKASGTESSVVLAAEQRDQTGLKAINSSSNICLHFYNARLCISAFQSAYPVAIN